MAEPEESSSTAILPAGEDLRLDEVLALLKVQGQRETAAGEAIKYLSSELDVLKRQQSAGFVRPLLLDLLRALDRMESDLAQAPNSQLEEYHDEILEALQRFEVTAIEEAADEFNPELHLAVRTVAAESAPDDLRVAQVLRKGYRHKRVVLRPVEVSIYKFRPASPAANS